MALNNSPVMQNNSEDSKTMSILKVNATFERAVAETKFGIFNCCLIIVSGLILANVLLETVGISYTLPVSCNLHLTVKQKGVLSAIGFVGIISSSHLWGFLADTSGRRAVIRPTLIIGFIITVFSSFSTCFWMLTILRFLNGVFISGGSATIYAYLGEFHTEKTRGRAIMIASVIFGLGAMFMPIIAWLVINQDWYFYIDFLGIKYKPWRLFLIICGVPGFICGLCLYGIPESPKFLFSIGKEDEALEILSLIFQYNTGEDKKNYPIKQIIMDQMDRTISRKESIISESNPITGVFKEMWRQTIPLFSKQYLSKTFLTCLLQFLIFITSNGMFMWFPHIANLIIEFIDKNPGENRYICEIVEKKHSANGTEITEICNDKLEIPTFQYSLLLEGLYAIGFGLMGIVINFIGKKALLFIILVGCGSCGIAAIYVNVPYAAIYLFIIHLTGGLAIGVVNVAIVEMYPTQLRAMAVCVSSMMGRLGSVFGANLFGLLLIDHCEISFLVSGMALIITGFLGFFIPNPPKEVDVRLRRNSFISMTGN